jgi:hypothetical protein
MTAFGQLCSRLEAVRMPACQVIELTLPTQRSHMAPEIQREKADIAGRVAALR